MAVTANSVSREKYGWCRNAFTADASGCEEIQGAPGAGYRLVLDQLSIISDANITVTIGYGESTGAVEGVLFGPFPYGANTGNETDFHFEKQGVLLPENKSLTVDASGSGNVCVVAIGRTEEV